MIIQMYRDHDRKSVTYTAELRASFEIVDEINEVVTKDMIYDSLYRLLEDALKKEKNNKESKFAVTGY